MHKHTFKVTCTAQQRGKPVEEFYVHVKARDGWGAFFFGIAEGYKEHPQYKFIWTKYVEYVPVA